jgi:mannose-6-phosphate isomerase
MSHRTRTRDCSGDDFVAEMLREGAVARDIKANPVDCNAINIRSVAAAKVVVKHWGDERWLLDGDAPFAFKLIRLRRGMRTSLQLHRQKEEANLVVAGTAELVYKSDATNELERRVVGPGAVVHVRPRALHRLEALTDVVLVEVSTPEVDDVVRITDDWGRPDGRIEAEHRP